MTIHELGFIFLATTLGLAACGGGTGTSDGDESSSDGSSSGSTGGEPIVCGQPGEETTTDEQIADLEGCEIYRGSLLLMESASSLAPLSSLRVLEGELLVGGTNSPLPTLEGLEQLESVGEFTFVAHALPDFLPLQSLEEVEGEFQVMSMLELVDMRGLEQLRFVGADFVLLGNPMLTSLDGLDGLERVGGNFEATSYMTPLPRSEAQALVDRIEIGGDVNID